MTSRVDAVAALLGLVLIVAGVAQIHGPTAFIVAGGGVMAFALMAPRRR